MISIIIPTYNRNYILKKTLLSYYIQKYVKEIIIVDDNSNDNTKNFILDFSKKFKHIKNNIYL